MSAALSRRSDKESRLSADDLRAALVYDPDSGEFVWRTGARSMVGRTAGSLRNDGRVMVKVAGTFYYAHRLAWLYVHGVWPADQIDHINGNPSDNRLCNLREATAAQNSQNRMKAQANNPHGLLGVTFDKDSGKWRARLKYDGKNHSVGSFDCPHEAHAAYMRAKSERHPFSARIPAVQSDAPALAKSDPSQQLAALAALLARSTGSARVVPLDFSALDPDPKS